MRWLAADAFIVALFILSVALLTYNLWYPPLARLLHKTHDEIEDTTREEEERHRRERRKPRLGTSHDDQVRALRLLTQAERERLRRAGFVLPDEREFD